MRGARNSPIPGSLANAPSALRAVLNDPTLQVPKSKSTWEFEVSHGGAGLDRRNLFTHGDGMTDTVAILGHGNPALMRASELDAGLLGKSSEPLR